MMAMSIVKHREASWNRRRAAPVDPAVRLGRAYRPNIRAAPAARRPRRGCFIKYLKENDAPCQNNAEQSVPSNQCHAINASQPAPDHQCRTTPDNATQQTMCEGRDVGEAAAAAAAGLVQKLVEMDDGEGRLRGIRVGEKRSRG